MNQPSRASKTAERILQTAAKAFLDRGYRETSLEDVAAEAGVTKPTVYSHFGSKQGLLLALVQAHVSGTADAMSSSLDSSGDTAADLTRFGQIFLSCVMSPQASRWRRLCMAESLDHPEIGKTIFKAGPARVLKLIEKYITHETQEGRLCCGDPVLASEQFVGLLIGVQPIRESAGLARPSQAKQTQICNAAVSTFMAAFATAPTKSESVS